MLTYIVMGPEFRVTAQSSYSGDSTAAATHRQNDCENRASRNSPSFAVVLNWRIGSSSLKADVKHSTNSRLFATAR
jgi:hypothetical protein